MAFDSGNELARFIDSVIDKLRASRQEEAANLLQNLQTSVFTTSSEWLMELGGAIRCIQHRYSPSRDINEDLERMMDAVVGAWPSFRKIRSR
jgi:hypothetical protein